MIRVLVVPPGIRCCWVVDGKDVIQPVKSRHGVKATTFKAKAEDLTSKIKAKDLTSKAKDMASKAMVKDWTYKANHEAALRPCLQHLYYI